MRWRSTQVMQGAEIDSERRAMPAGWVRSLLIEQQLPLVLLAAPSFLLPWRPLQLVGIVSLLALIAARWVVKGRPLSLTPLDLPLLGLLVTVVVSLLVSLSPVQSSPLALGTWYGTILFYTVFAWVCDRKALLTIACLMVGVAAALVPVALIGTDWTNKTLTFLPASLYEVFPRLLGGLTLSSFGTERAGFHPNVIALALGMALPVPLALSLMPSDTLKALGRGSIERYLLLRPLLWGLALLCFGIIVLTQSRGTLLALAPALLLLAAWRWGAVRRRLKLLGLVAVIGLLAALVLFSMSQPLRERLSDASGFGWGSGGRLMIWDRALLMISDFPLTGIGLNNFPVLQPALYPASELRGHLWVTAHNLYLQTALDLGLPGLCFFALLIVTLVRLLRTAYHSTSDPFYGAMSAALGAVLLVWLVNGFVDTPIRLGDKFGIWVWLVFGVICALPTLVKSTRPIDAPHL